MNKKKAIGAAYENARDNWLNFQKSLKRKKNEIAIVENPVNVPNSPDPVPAYKLSLTNKASFRPLEDLVYTIDDQPRLSIHGLRGVIINHLPNGKMVVEVECDERATKNFDTTLFVQNSALMEKFWPFLNKSFGRKEVFYQYQIDKYASFLKIEGDFLSFGLALGMEFIPKICQLIELHGCVEGKKYSCTRFVRHLEAGLGFTPEVVFGNMGKSNVKFLDIIGVYLKRSDNLEPISYAIDMNYLENKWFQFENLEGRRNYDHRDKRQRILLP